MRVRVVDRPHERPPRARQISLEVVAVAVREVLLEVLVGLKELAAPLEGAPGSSVVLLELVQSIKTRARGREAPALAREELRAAAARVVAAARADARGRVRLRRRVGLARRLLDQSDRLLVLGPQRGAPVLLLLFLLLLLGFLVLRLVGGLVAVRPPPFPILAQAVAQLRGLLLEERQLLGGVEGLVGRVGPRQPRRVPREQVDLVAAPRPAVVQVCLLYTSPSPRDS